jgi:hypothetical protein
MNAAGLVGDSLVGGGSDAGLLSSMAVNATGSMLPFQTDSAAFLSLVQLALHGPSDSPAGLSLELEPRGNDPSGLSDPTADLKSGAFADRFASGGRRGSPTQIADALIRSMLGTPVLTNAMGTSAMNTAGAVVKNDFKNMGPVDRQTESAGLDSPENTDAVGLDEATLAVKPLPVSVTGDDAAIARVEEESDTTRIASAQASADASPTDTFESTDIQDPSILAQAVTDSAARTLKNTGSPNSRGKASSSGTSSMKQGGRDRSSHSFNAPTKASVGNLTLGGISMSQSNGIELLRPPPLNGSEADARRADVSELDGSRADRSMADRSVIDRSVMNASVMDPEPIDGATKSGARSHVFVAQTGHGAATTQSHSAVAFSAELTRTAGQQETQNAENPIGQAHPNAATVDLVQQNAALMPSGIAPDVLDPQASGAGDRQAEDGPEIGKLARQTNYARRAIPTALGNGGAGDAESRSAEGFAVADSADGSGPDTGDDSPKRRVDGNDWRIREDSREMRMAASAQGGFAMHTDFAQNRAQHGPNSGSGVETPMPTARAEEQAAVHQIGIDQAAKTQPANEIAIRVDRPDASQVDLQIRQRGGELHVSVRTADANLRGELRAELPELVNSLSRAGFQARTFTPAEASVRAASESFLGSGNESNSGQPGSGFGNGSAGGDRGTNGGQSGRGFGGQPQGQDSPREQLQQQWMDKIEG